MATDAHTIKLAARTYSERGLRVIPLWGVTETGDCRCSKGAACRSQGKHPVWNEWQSQPRIAEDRIDQNFSAGRNVGVATGKDSGIFVLDIDPDNGGFESAKALADKHGSFANSTMRIKTGSGGYHLYFKLPPFELRNSAGKVGKGIDIRAEGGQVVAPPSISSKGAYTLDNDAEIAFAPDWLLEILRSKPQNTARVTIPRADVEKLGDAETARLLAYSEGAVANEKRRLHELALMGWDKPWNQTTFEVACNLIQLANAHWSHIEIEHAWDIVYNESPDRETGYDDEVVRRTFDSARSTIGDKETPAPDAPVDLSFMFPEGEPSPPKEPGVDEPAVDEEEPEVFYTVGNIPLDGKRLDPNLVQVRAAKTLDREYHSGKAYGQLAEVDHWIDLTRLPKSREADPEDLIEVDHWVDTAIRSGTPELFWAALGYLILGTDPLTSSISMKGCGAILAALTEDVGAQVGRKPGVLLFGPELHSLDGADITIEFADIKPEFDVSDFLPEIVHKAIASWSALKASGKPLASATETRELKPTREASLGKMRHKISGLGSRERGSGDDFYV